MTLTDSRGVVYNNENKNLLKKNIRGSVQVLVKHQKKMFIFCIDIKIVNQVYEINSN